MSAIWLGQSYLEQLIKCLLLQDGLLIELEEKNFLKHQKQNKNSNWPKLPVLVPRGAQRLEHWQMAGFRKPRGQKGWCSAVHLVYKLQREAAVSTPL